MNTKQKIQNIIGNAYRSLLILAFLLGPLTTGTAVYAQQKSDTSGTNQVSQGKIFVPLVIKGISNDLPLMIGVYPVGWPEAKTINNEMKPMDNWLTGVTGGQSTSIFGTFMPLNLTDAIAKPNVEDPLTVIWNAGYTPFVNLPALPNDTAYNVASGKYDAMITTWAKSFKNYANGGARFAYIAPLQEMNGEWVKYGGDPGNFILAFKPFQDDFCSARGSIKVGQMGLCSQWLDQARTSLIRSLLSGRRVCRCGCDQRI